MRVLLYLLLAYPIMAGPALAATLAMTRAADRLAGPVPATVERVIDGDTLVVRAKIWLGMEITIKVRLADVDAPELHRPKCAAERRKAQEAKSLIEKAVGAGAITLYDVHHGKYAGRVVARVETKGGGLAEVLKTNGLSEQQWCAE